MYSRISNFWIYSNRTGNEIRFFFTLYYFFQHHLVKMRPQKMIIFVMKFSLLSIHSFSFTSYNISFLMRKGKAQYILLDQVVVCIMVFFAS